MYILQWLGNKLCKAEIFAEPNLLCLCPPICLTEVLHLATNVQPLKRTASTYNISFGRQLQYALLLRTCPVRILMESETKIHACLTSYYQLISSEWQATWFNYSTQHSKQDQERIFLSFCLYVTLKRILPKWQQVIRCVTTPMNL